MTIASSDTAISTATPKSAGVAQMTLGVTDNGTLSLTASRRLIMTNQPASA